MRLLAIIPTELLDPNEPPQLKWRFETVILPMFGNMHTGYYQTSFGSFRVEFWPDFANVDMNALFIFANDSDTIIFSREINLSPSDKKRNYLLFIEKCISEWLIKHLEQLYPQQEDFQLTSPSQSNRIAESTRALFQTLANRL